ncbi:MAG TPA: hypothetical protein VNX68_11270, partial [Nitrosopumilaceae archaeon]|nr:hypothetical protein [Nitrosopumilaceae archaeon]
MYRLSFLTIFCFFVLNGFTQPKADNKTDEKGNKQGYWIKTNDKGKRVYEGTFKDDKPIGKFKYYNVDIDSVRIILDFQKDGKTAYSTNFHYNGKVAGKGKYINQQKDSTWNYYDESGKLLSTENYLDGKRNGKSVTYDGPKTIEEKNYKDDKLNGNFKQYFGDKRLKSEGSYMNNEYYGKCTFYFPNGQAAATGVYD